MAAGMMGGALIAICVCLLLQRSRRFRARQAAFPGRPAWGRQVKRLAASLVWFFVLSFAARFVSAFIVTALTGTNMQSSPGRFLAKEMAAVQFLARYGPWLEAGATAAAIIGTWTGALPGTNPAQADTPRQSEENEEWRPLSGAESAPPDTASQGMVCPRCFGSKGTWQQLPGEATVSWVACPFCWGSGRV